MKIKTIVHNEAKEFDEQVNNSLMLGYTLRQRNVIQFDAGIYHYAQLEQEGPAEPQLVDPVDLARQLRDFCLTREYCYDCPMKQVCDPAYLDPSRWHIPEGEEALEV